MWRRSAKLEALAFDSGVTSLRNETGRDTTTATPCGQNSAQITNGLGCQDS